MTATLLDLTGSGSLSYSSMSSYLDCGERYRLEKVAKVPQSGAWWFIGGSAVHTATELLDKGEVTDPQEAWDQAFTGELARAEDVGSLRAGGRATKEWPNKEDGAWWSHHGPLFVQRWCDWRAKNGWTLLFVEQPFEVEVGGVLVRGYVDRGFADRNGQAVVIDLKTGNHMPPPLQLAIYRLGLLKTLGQDFTMGGYWSARKGDTGELHLLPRFTEDLVGQWLSNVKTGIEAGLFTPRLSALCNSCSVNTYCAAYGGTPPALDHIFQVSNATSHNTKETR